MDLVAGVRKEGSRGGRDSFKWSDVKESQHRENYLGHSLMAPVGRWQKGRDLQWYAKADDEEAADKERTEREEEIRRVKEAEQEAMARALGLPVAPKTTNANLTPLGGKDVQRAIQETAGDEAEGGKGIGFGSYGGGASAARLGSEADKLEGVGLEERPSRRDKRDRSRSRERRRDRSRDRNRDRDRERDGERRYHRHRHRHDRERQRHERRHRSRSKSLSRDLDYRRRPPSRERSREGRRTDDYERHRRSGRSCSPDQDHRSHRRSGRDRSDSRR